jgi:hypothetical protein
MVTGDKEARRLKGMTPDLLVSFKKEESQDWRPL